MEGPGHGRATAGCQAGSVLVQWSIISRRSHRCRVKVRGLALPLNLSGSWFEGRLVPELIPVWLSAPGNLGLSGGLKHWTGSLGLDFGLRVIFCSGSPCDYFQQAILLSQSSDLLIARTCSEYILLYSIHWCWNAHSFMCSFIQYSLRAH